MVKQYGINPNKTYANKKNAEKAVEKMIAKNPWMEEEKARFTYSIIWNEEGRCFPVFFGASSIQAGIFHLGFNCVAFS